MVSAGKWLIWLVIVACSLARSLSLSIHSSPVCLKGRKVSLYLCFKNTTWKLPYSWCRFQAFLLVYALKASKSKILLRDLNPLEVPGGGAKERTFHKNRFLPMDFCLNPTNIWYCISNPETKNKNPSLPLSAHCLTWGEEWEAGSILYMYWPARCIKMHHQTPSLATPNTELWQGQQRLYAQWGEKQHLKPGIYLALIVLWNNLAWKCHPLHGCVEYVVQPFCGRRSTIGCDYHTWKMDSQKRRPVTNIRQSLANCGCSL